MLCDICQQICLDFRHGAYHSIIRQHSGLSELKSTSSACDFCALVEDAMEVIVDPSGEGYGKKSWGADFYDALLNVSPISVSHVSQNKEHNIRVGVYLDAENEPGYPGGPRNCTWSFVFGGIYVPPDSDVSDLVAGRPFESELSKDEQITLARDWFQGCQLKHEQCRLPASPDFMPTRLLDLRPDDSSDGMVSLIVTTGTFQRPYATLSYCWGDAQNVRLTMATIQEFTSEGMSRMRLPATLREACELCLGIGIRYLWIDSLCIVQDSESDWREQSSKMATIYNSSALTISAASGRDCDAGLFGGETLVPRLAATFKWRSSGNIHGTCWARAGPLLVNFSEPTERRGWTLQETLLSRRVLVRGTEQLSWQCVQSQQNQSGTVVEPSPALAAVFPCPPTEYSLRYEDITNHDLFITKPVAPSIPQIWMDLVSAYMRRELSLSKDKLPAISGLAKWLHRSCPPDDQYLAGLWKSQLPYCLLWYNNLTFPADISQATRPPTYRAPSWTWAALDCDKLEWFKTNSSNEAARILDHRLFYKSEDTFGEVTDGYLDIEAPMQQGWLVPDSRYPESFNFWNDSWASELDNRGSAERKDSLGWARCDVYDAKDLSRVETESPRQRAWACECIRITADAGLLVCASERHTRESDDPLLSRPRRRVGIVELEPGRAARWWEGVEPQIVRLV